MARAKARAKHANGGLLGFEATLWDAADKLRGNMDAAHTSTKWTRSDGSWGHVDVTLRPDSIEPTYEPIVLTDIEDENEIRVVAELIEVLPHGA